MTAAVVVSIVPPVFFGGPSSAKAVPAREREQIGMPASPDAERAILGAIMLDNDCLYEVGSELLSCHFSLESHRRIYGTMFEMREEGMAIDIITLSDFMGKRGDLKKVGGSGYLSSLTDLIAAKPSVTHHIKLLKEKASLRQIINVGEAMVARAVDQQESAEKIVALCDIELQEILSDVHGGSSDVKRIGECAGEFFDNMAMVRAYKQELIGLTYGISNVDHATTGLRNGEMTILAGRPGAGKTSAALGVAIKNAENMVPVYYKSAEMKSEGLFSRTLSALTKINNFRIRDPRQLTADEDKKLALAAEEAKLYPLWIDDRPGQHIAQVLATARLFVRKHGVKLCIFDYAQLINADGKDRVERVGNVAEAVAVFGREMNIPTVLLSQLSRPDRKNANVLPTMDELKESGRLEENADVVVLLHRQVGDKEGEDWAIIAKQRNGPVGKEKVYFNKETLLYHPRD